MTNLRVALIGAAGRMGQAIIGLAKSEGVEIVARIDLGDQLAFADADVAIDFSHADATASICKAAIKSKTPLLIGTQLIPRNSATILSSRRNKSRLSWRQISVSE